jgi:hypothetical protein
MWVRGDWALKVGRGGGGSEWAEGQKDHPEGQESAECDIGADARVVDSGGTGKGNKESVVSIPPVKARRDAFI